MTSNDIEDQLDYEQELKEFVRIVSHDLRSPIRHIKEFYSLFMEDLELDLSDDQRELKSFLENSIDLAASQMDSLLKLSRINTSPVLVECFDFVPFLESVIENIDPERKCLANIELDNRIDSAVYMSKHNVYIACHEVIVNALTFSRPGEAASVCVRAFIENDIVSVVVADRGIGVDEKYSEQIYQPYRRLNHVNQYPGLGMGLALARRALTRIGGGINYEKNNHQGATFTLHIPSNRPKV